MIEGRTGYMIVLSSPSGAGKTTLTKMLAENNERFIILLLIITFLFSLIISLYHFGIEQGFFEESTVCGQKNATDIISKEELLKQLQEKTISCKDVTFRIFGLSLTSINILISFILTGILTKIFIYYEKN